MIAIVDYHKGNLKSVERGLVGVGANVCITDNPHAIAKADAIVLPGVGAFTDAITELHACNLVNPLLDAFAKDKPFLGICLGQHLLYEAGEEHAKGDPTPGLGVLKGTVRALPKRDIRGNAYKIPHVGWNEVVFLSKRPNALFAGINDGEFFYFTHSYVAPASPETIATTGHSMTFPSVVQFGTKEYAVQFHPEKSSDAGIRLLKNFVSMVERV